ncbi:hypothetical protein HDU84_005116 [Entophlyctis sp. JEL0112]|nr:hypothetical protein HDU84_005116 [Entophlyctis sp. JEL0112]
MSNAELETVPAHSLLSSSSVPTQPPIDPVTTDKQWLRQATVLLSKLQKTLAGNASAKRPKPLDAKTLGQLVDLQLIGPEAPWNPESSAMRRRVESFSRPVTVSVGRKKVFVAWPHKSDPLWECSAEKIALTGMYYRPPNPEENDYAMCQYCQLGLAGWERNDDPIYEHKKRSNECIMFKGPEVISQIDPAIISSLVEPFKNEVAHPDKPASPGNLQPFPDARGIQNLPLNPIDASVLKRNHVRSIAALTTKRAKKVEAEDIRVSAESSEIRNASKVPTLEFPCEERGRESSESENLQSEIDAANLERLRLTRKKEKDTKPSDDGGGGSEIEDKPKRRTRLATAKAICENTNASGKIRLKKMKPTMEGVLGYGDANSNAPTNCLVSRQSGNDKTTDGSLLQSDAILDNGLPLPPVIGDDELIVELDGLPEARTEVVNSLPNRATRKKKAPNTKSTTSKSKVQSSKSANEPQHEIKKVPAHITTKKPSAPPPRRRQKGKLEDSNEQPEVSGPSEQRKDNFKCSEIPTAGPIPNELSSSECVQPPLTSKSTPNQLCIERKDAGPIEASCGLKSPEPTACARDASASPIALCAGTRANFSQMLMDLDLEMLNHPQPGGSALSLAADHVLAENERAGGLDGFVITPADVGSEAALSDASDLLDCYSDAFDGEDDAKDGLRASISDGSSESEFDGYIETALAAEKKQFLVESSCSGFVKLMQRFTSDPVKVVESLKDLSAEEQSMTVEQLLKKLAHEESSRIEKITNELISLMMQEGRRARRVIEEMDI